MPSFCQICGGWPCRCCQSVPSVLYPYYTWIQTVDEPKSCVGKAHVFECEHVETSKCGQITRVMKKDAKKRK